MNPAEQITVLNVDDLESQRYVKTRDLHAGGFAVIEARTGAEALRLVEQHRPPVVLLDVQLPDIDGFEVCAFIKRKWPEVMVLQTSATFTTVMDRVQRPERRRQFLSRAARRAARTGRGHQCPVAHSTLRGRVAGAERRSRQASAGTHVGACRDEPAIAPGDGAPREGRNRNYCRPRRWKPSAN